MAFDRVGLSSEGRSVLSALKSRDFNVYVRAVLIDVKLSMNELIRLTVSALSGYTCTELSTVSSLGTEINVVAKGFSELPQGSETYPSGYSVALLVTPQNGMEVCLIGASCDEAFVADSSLNIRFGLEETDNMFTAKVDFDGDVTYGILASEIASVRSSIPTRTSQLTDDVPFVTVATNQTITGNKDLTGTLTLKSANHPEDVYTTLHTSSSSSSSPQFEIFFLDMQRSVAGTTSFHSSRNGSNQFFYNTLYKYDANNNWSTLGGVLTRAYIGDHYHTLSDEYLICFPGEATYDSAVVGPYHEAARALNDFYASSSDPSRQQLAVYDQDDDYKERIRLRRVEYTESVGSVPSGTVKTYLELFAKTITNVAEEVHFQYTETETITHPLWDETEQAIVQVSHQGPVAHDLLVISKTGGVYSTQFTGGYKIGNISYAFGTAGSLAYETSITSDADNQHIPTSYAVKSYVDSVTGNVQPPDMSGYLTTTVAAQTYQPIGSYALSSELPTKTSDLTNDSGFITSSDLTANYITTDTLQTIYASKTFDVGYDASSGGFRSVTFKGEVDSSSGDYVEHVVSDGATTFSHHTNNTTYSTRVQQWGNALFVEPQGSSSSSNTLVVPSAEQIQLYSSPTQPLVRESLEHYTLKHGQEHVVATTSKPSSWPSGNTVSGLFVESIQDSLYDGMCLNIWISDTVTVGYLNLLIGGTISSLPVYFRGNSRTGGVHNVKIHAGSMLSVTYSSSDAQHVGWYADTYDLGFKKVSSDTLAKNYVGLVEYDDPVDNGSAYSTHSPNLIMMTSNGKWFPVIDKTTKTANAISGQIREFTVHPPILVDLNTEGSTGTPNAFATHPNVRLHDFLAYMNWSDPEDLIAGEVTRDQNEEVLYRTSALDLYLVSCDHTRYSDLQTMLTNALNAYVSEGGTLSGTVASEVSAIMDDVQSFALPRKICSNYTSGTFDALRNGMYTHHPCDGYIDEDLYAHFTSYRQGCPIWLQGWIRVDGTFHPYKVDHALSSYGILLGFETEFGKLNFQPDNGLYKSIRVNDSVQIQRVTWPTVSDTLHFPNGTLHNVDSSTLTSSMSIHAPSFVGNVIGGIPYGSCTTAADTVTKEVTLSPDPGFLTEGMLICVRFSYTNSASLPTLKINGTGYYGSPLSIYRSGTTSSGNTAYTSWSAGEELLLRYDGVKWVMVGTHSSVQSANYALQLNNNRTLDGVTFNNTASITHYTTCTSPANTATKVVILEGFVLATGARIAVKFLNSNSASSPMLNVSNGSSYTGAKAIKFGDDVSVGTDNYSKWQAGDIVEFIYDGTYWVMVGFQVYASYASQATRATCDESGNTISTYYCTLTTDQTISGNKTLSGTTYATGSLYVTGYSSGGMRFSDSTSMQETDYVRFRGNCGSSSYSGIDFQFYVNSSLSNTISFKDDETDLTTIPSASNTWSIGSNTKTLKAVYATTFNGNATSATKATQDANGDTIRSSYASELRTYTRPANSSSTTYGSTSSTYLSLYSKSNNLLSRAYISDIVANALRGSGGFGYGSAAATSSSAGYRTYSSFGSVGSLGLFAVPRTSSDTSSTSPGNSISGTSLTHHAIPYRKSTGSMTLAISSVTLSGTWYLLNYLYAYSSSYTQDYQMVLAVRVL